MNDLLLKQNSDIVYGKFRLKKNGLEAVGNPSFDDWAEVGKFIKRSNEAVQFWRGDWLNFGENNYEEWSQYFGKEEAAYQTLANEKWVASRVPPSRRRENLSWSHHAEVADLESEEQELMLNMAEEHEMSVSTFRKAVRHYKLKLDVPELNEEQLKPTDPLLFESAQKIVDSSVSTIEMLEKLEWEKMESGARDWLLSHLKRAGTYYFNLVKKYDIKKPLS
jgi:hypothetical protein